MKGRWGRGRRQRRGPGMLFRGGGPTLHPDPQTPRPDLWPVPSTQTPHGAVTKPCNSSSECSPNLAPSPPLDIGAAPPRPAHGGASPFLLLPPPFSPAYPVSTPGHHPHRSREPHPQTFPQLLSPSPGHQPHVTLTWAESPLPCLRCAALAPPPLCLMTSYSTINT